MVGGRTARRRTASRSPSGRPALSVVVMGYRNAETIEAAIGSALDQESGEPFEVVVVTSGGDDSGDRVRRAHPELALCESPTRLLPGGARNAGIELAAGEYVAFLEADCLARPGWVEARIRAHRAGHRAVSSAVLCAPSESAWARAFVYLLYATRLPRHAASEVAWPDPRAHGVSLAQDVFDEVGLFDSSLRIGEDTDMAQRLARHGIPVYFDPKVLLEVRPPATPWKMLRDVHARGAQHVRENRAPPPAATTAGILRRQMRRFWPRLRWTARLALRYGGGRRRVVPALPWLAAALLSLTLGRLRAFRRGADRHRSEATASITGRA